MLKKVSFQLYKVDVVKWTEKLIWIESPHQITEKDNTSHRSHAIWLRIYQNFGITSAWTWNKRDPWSVLVLFVLSLFPWEESTVQPNSTLVNSQKKSNDLFICCKASCNLLVFECKYFLIPLRKRQSILFLSRQSATSGH